MAMLAPWIRAGGREHALHVIIEERSVRTRAIVAHGAAALTFECNVRMVPRQIKQPHFS